MITEIQNFRQKYPEYNDLDDATLATNLANKYPEYSDLPDKVKGEGKTMREMIPVEGVIKKPPPRWVEPIGKAVEAIGLLGGGAVGTASMGLGPGTAVGAGAGYAASKGLYEKGLEIAGVYKPQTIAETAIRVGKDIPIGMAYEMGGQIGGKVVIGVIQKTISPFSKIASASETIELKRLYSEFGIKPFPSEIVPGQKSLSILEGVLSYRPVSGDVMMKEGMKKLDILNSVREQLIAKSATSEDIELVGNLIRRQAKETLGKYTQAKGDKLQGLVDDFTTRFGVTNRYRTGEKFSEVMSADRTSRQQAIKGMYDDVTQQLPGKGSDIVEITPDTKQLAKQLLKEETSKLPKLQDKSIVDLLESVSKEPKLPEGVTQTMLDRDPGLRKLIEAKQPKMTWEGLQNSRSDLLEKVRIIHKAQGEATKESRVYSALSDAIDKDMGVYAQKTGGDVWQNFLDARQAVKTMHELYDKDLLKIMNKPVEDILGRIVKSGEVTLLKQIKSAAGNAGIEPLRKGFFNEVITQATRNGTVDPKLIHKIITRPGMEETLRELATPQQISMLQNIVQKGAFFSTKMKEMKTVEFLETLAGGTNEGIVNHIFRPNNRENIQLAKKLLPVEQIKKIESMAIEKVLNLSKAGFYLPVTSAGQFAKYNIPLRELLTPVKYQKLNDFIKLGQNMSRVEALAKNASQTGQVLLGSQIASSLLSRPDMAIKTLGIPYVASKIYSSDLALKYFSNAIKMPVGSKQAVSDFIKAWVIASEDMGKELSERGIEEVKSDKPTGFTYNPQTGKIEPK